MDTDRGRALTPHGRWQVFNGLVRPVIKYEGDLETRPITSLEVVWIVRSHHQFSASLNSHYGLRIQPVRGPRHQGASYAPSQNLPQVGRGPDVPDLPPTEHPHHVADWP